MKGWLSLLTVLLALPSHSFADGMIVIHQPPPWSGPRPMYVFAPLQVVYHHVNVTIDGQIARTSVDQEFFNPNDQRLEGTYLFPVPKGAQIDKFTMEIGGEQVEAELLSADKARALYEDIVRKMRDPALLEYAGQDVFKVHVFPIEPHANKHITLSYTEVLKADNGLVGYLYPLNTEKFSAAPIKDVSVKIELDAHRPLKSIYSPSHSVEIHRHGTDRAVIGFEGKDIKPDTDLQLFWQGEEKDLGVSLLTYREPGEDGYFLLLAAPGPELKTKEIVKKSIVFVLDTSGSMAGLKLTQAKKALQFCVDNLNEGDRFEISRFATESEPVFDKLVAATDNNRRRATEFIKNLNATGGTAIEEALLKALALKPDVIIFLTDGQPTVGDTREDDILAAVKRANASNARVFCFGLGTDVNTHLLDSITEQTRAFSQYVLPEEDIEVKVSNFYSKIKEAVLADPQLRFTGGVHTSKLCPTPLPDMFLGDQLIILGRYAGTGDAVAVMEGTVNGQMKKFAFDVKFPEQASDHGFIPRLWASRRIGHLLDEIRLHGETRELRDEVTSLAHKYGIVTPYTAYLIDEDESRRNVPVTTRTLQDFERDRVVREQAGKSWSTFGGETAGMGAVSGARATASFRQVGNIGDLATSAKMANSTAFINATPSPAAPEVAKRFDQYARNTRFVNGRAFFQNGTQWVDADVQKLPNARRVQIKFSSPEYFDLLAKNPGAGTWFALGRNLQIPLDDTVYEITE